MKSFRIIVLVVTALSSAFGQVGPTTPPVNQFSRKNQMDVELSVTTSNETKLIVWTNMVPRNNIAILKSWITGAGSTNFYHGDGLQIFRHDDGAAVDSIFTNVASIGSSTTNMLSGWITNGSSNDLLLYVKGFTNENVNWTIWTSTVLRTNGAFSPPMFSEEPTVTATNATDATIEWVTDYEAHSQVIYGLTTNYGFTNISPTLVTEHSLSISNLVAGTNYNFKVTSTNAYGGVNTTNKVFATPAAP